MTIKCKLRCIIGCSIRKISFNLLIQEFYYGIINLFAWIKKIITFSKVYSNIGHVPFPKCSWRILLSLLMDIHMKEKPLLNGLKDKTSLQIPVFSFLQLTWSLILLSRTLCKGLTRISPDFWQKKKDTRLTLHSLYRKSITSRLNFSTKNQRMTSTLIDKKENSRPKRLRNPDIRTRMFNWRSSEIRKMYSRNNFNKSEQESKNTSER